MLAIFRCVPDFALKHQPSGERWFDGKRWGWVLVGMGGKGGGIRNNGGISLDLFVLSSNFRWGGWWRFWG